MGNDEAGGERVRAARPFPDFRDVAGLQPGGARGPRAATLLLVLAILSLFVVAASAQAAPTQFTPARAARIPPGQLVRFTQTGGFAYTNRTLSVDQVGRVVAVDTDGTLHRLQLSPSEVTTLRRALGRLSGLDGRRYLLPSSADTFVYRVVTGNSTVRYEDGATPPAAVGAADAVLRDLLKRTLGS